MTKQPFTLGKYLLGFILTIGFSGFAYQSGLFPKENTIALIIIPVAYLFIGFFVFASQTIKYAKLNKREQKIYEAELERKEKELNIK